ncbi:DNA polymerase III subunit chi [Desulforhabdus sp. TSK]|uniref:DNA polymerase III subunit chi n=1 Tax=Desulforhabdus sp. TSK TaxID=2925014 RepID=UPI001FC80D52|nr:DNA polymerase III subunit chi [Desulforhabdus sp. TSK]GKT08027.1 hypothetical protein DSTSK_13320 [Desulforhabdus sp. TSK]
MASTLIYFVETPSEKQRFLLCRWVDRFHEAGRKVQVLVDSTLAAQHLDQMLWTFAQESFIPHRVLTSKGSVDIMEPVVITVGEIVVQGFQILVCDGPPRLDFAAKYPEVVHFVLRDDPEKKQESRLLWQAAKDRGMELRHVPYGGVGDNVRHAVKGGESA